MKPIVRWIVPAAAVMPTIAVVFATFALAWWTNDMVAIVTTTIFDAATYAASHAATGEKSHLVNGCDAPSERQP
jgi:hypothetical protein